MEFGSRTEVEHGWGLLAVRTPPWNSEGRYRVTCCSPKLWSDQNAERSRGESPDAEVLSEWKGAG